MRKMICRSKSGEQNIMKPGETRVLPFGIRVSLADKDPFASLVGDNWSKTHWFATQAERDQTIVEMQRRHEYSRRSDKPAIKLEAIKQ
jgi:hypothetical protein